MRALTWLLISYPIMMIKCLSRYVSNSEFLSVYSHVRQIKRKDAHKINLLHVCTTKNNGNNSCVRIHAWSKDLFKVYMVILFYTHLNAQKIMFLSVYTRFSKFLSAWVMTQVSVKKYFLIVFRFRKLIDCW